MQGISVLVLEPTVDGLVEVVEVILRTASSVTHARSVTDVHALLPTVVRTKSLEKVTTVGSESIGEVFSTSHDVVTNILAVTTRSIATLVVSQLHETLFSTATNGVGIAATLLEGDRSQEDGRKTVLLAKLLEGPNERAASSEWTALRNGSVEVHRDQIGDKDEGGIPPSAVDTTVHPIKSSVGTGGRSNLLSGTGGSAAIILNLNEAIRVGRSRTCVGSWARGGARTGSRGVVWRRIRVLVVVVVIVVAIRAVAVVVTRVILVARGRTLSASSVLITCTTEDTTVIGTLDVVVMKSLSKDRESSENNEGGEELHNDGLL